jgi:hypothetical protein
MRSWETIIKLNGGFSSMPPLMTSEGIIPWPIRTSFPQGPRWTMWSSRDGSWSAATGLGAIGDHGYGSGLFTMLR